MKRLLLFLFFPELSFRKQVEERKVSKKKLIYCVAINGLFPILFLVLGLIIHVSPLLKEKIQKQITTTIPETADDYLRYAPIPFVFATQWMGMPAASSVLKRSGVIVLAYVASDFVVHRTKKTTHTVRPNGDPNSFPSQHSNQAFLGAMILHHEYVGSSAAVSAAGFACASSVALLRVARDRHWSSDVLVGAAVGMFTVNLIYLFIYALLYTGVRKGWNVVTRKVKKG